MALQDFDKLNIVKRRSIPYAKYFGDMDLTKEQKERRKDLALILEDIIAIWFAIIEQSYENDLLEETWAKQELFNMLYNEIEGKGYFPTETEQNNYISNLVTNTYQTTIENLDENYDDVVAKSEDKKPESVEDVEPYWVSSDRAKLIAENESNTLYNSKEYIDATNEGYTHKIWMSYGDERVRVSHQIVDGAKVPIGVYFDVGAARMLYPKDVSSELSTGAEHPEETINCRCTIKYV